MPKFKSNGPRCLACNRNARCRPRGLCFGCYADPVVRSQHHSTDPRGRRGEGIITGAGLPPRSPTTYLPGSDEKVEVMAARAARGEQLFHPLDAA